MVSCKNKIKNFKGQKKACKYILIHKKSLLNYQSSPHFNNSLISSVKRLPADLFVFIRFFLGRISFGSHVPSVQAITFAVVQSKLFY